MVVAKNTHAQYFEWVRQMGSVADTDRSILDQDNDGNLLTVALFEGSADFDHSDGELEFNAGASKDIFISKTGPNGDFYWAKQIRSINNFDMLYFWDLIVDAENNFYITGSYVGDVDFDPNPAVDNIVGEVHPSNDDQDIFVAKYTADGDLIWVRTIGSFETDLGRSLNILSNGNLVVTGEFRGNVDFDPGTETATISSSNNALFILILNQDGEFIDAKFIAGTSNAMNIYHTSVDAYDNLYLSGGFFGTADFDPTSATYSMTAAGSGATRFICKLDNNLACSWVKPFFVTALGGYVGEVKVDDQGNIFFAGWFWGGIDLDPAEETSFDLVSAGYSDTYVAKLNEQGEFVWGLQFGGTDSDEAVAIELMDNGDLLVGINIRSASVDMDPGPGTQTLTNGGSYDLALVKLSADGDFSSMVHFTGSQLQQVNDLVVTPEAIFTSGTFSGNTDFDPGTGVATLSPDETWDYFIHKMGFLPSGIDQTDANQRLNIYPNPTNGLVNIQFEDSQRVNIIEIYSETGQLIYHGSITAERIDLSQVPQGVYMIQSKDVNGNILLERIVRR